MKNILVLFCLLTLITHGQKKNLDQKIQEFEAYIVKAQKEWEVPGLAVAVVKDGQVLMAKGFGVRRLSDHKPVDAETLFACASTTKAMTATCMGILVDEGKITWDAPVINFLPEFQLSDPYITREIKIRDLFVHDTGIGNADFLWSIMEIPTEQVLLKMRDVKPSYSLRSGFIYQNIFYAAAGKIIERLSGKPWSEFIGDRIFKPLKMNRTVPFLKDVKDGNQTSAHFKIENKITPITHSSADAIGPAGSVWSSIQDMSKWMTCMLDSSKYEGGRLLSKNTWTEMFKPQVLVPANQFYPTMRLTNPHWTTYGLGWFQHDYKGKKINFHTGSLAGAIAIHAQLPEEKLGIYVFGNYDHAEVRHALVYKAFDHFALGGTRDWSTEFLKLYNDLQAVSEKATKDFESERVLNTKSTFDLEAYTGTYSDPLYGELIITRTGEQLVGVANGVLRATFDHWHFDTFRGWYDKKWYGKVNASFSIGPNGKISKILFDGIEFNRIP